MCGAYACLANGGVYREPTCLTSIVDRYGNEMLQGEQEGIVYTMGTASTMKDLLSGVMLRGTGSGLGWYERTDIPAYVKTGTTNDQKDGWMCGWTENDGEINVMSVWVGCDMPKGLQGLWGSTWPGSVWVDSMLSVDGYKRQTLYRMKRCRRIPRSRTPGRTGQWFTSRSTSPWQT